MNQKTSNLKAVYQEGVYILERAEIREAKIDAWLLLEHITGIDKAHYYAAPEKDVTEKEYRIYKSYIEKRKNRIPLQHITGEQEFMGLSFQVNEHVLIPRQDTELLSEEGSEMLQPDMRILDLCTGSGCILISLAYAGRERGIRGLSFTGSDISKDALAVAEKNAKTHHICADWVESDLFDKVEGTFDMIVSNPPYIRTGEIEKLEEEVKAHDPFIALDGRKDGLYFYQRIVEKACRYLNDNGRILFEIGYDQKDSVCAMLHEAGFTKICCKKDLAGLDRVVTGMYNIPE